VPNSRARSWTDTPPTVSARPCRARRTTPTATGSAR
jgi:hypothetical protein